MAVSNRIKNQHLLWRAAFGPMAENAASLDTISQKNLWDLLVKTSSKPVEKIEVTKKFNVSALCAKMYKLKFS